MIEMQFKYYNSGLNIVFNDWRAVYLVQDGPILLKPEVHRSSLVYRLPGTKKRISYKRLKKGMVRQNVSLMINLLERPAKPVWL